ncbi:PilZ domain-containing protein [Desulfovibrio ferrophilus]|uniref:Type IV pilus assembly PilZ n=1 Tax=Desulfovibrio ferrophilus TaxID=241368 RepID=A0A2Z6AXM4_9BACT|nr:PilZ domain-containing protein [Desulfovibrio ferrophilus]BBD07958.1 type IV pilus assembly PilZ [Desulfovibrio ferrophilus]
MPGEDKRAAPRFSLKLKGNSAAYTAEVAQCGTVHCELLDVSSGGLRGRLLNPDTLDTPLERGLVIELQSFASERLEFMQDKTGTIAWYNQLGSQFGVRFDDNLPKDDVEALIFHFSSFFG